MVAQDDEEDDYDYEEHGERAFAHGVDERQHDPHALMTLAWRLAISASKVWMRLRNVAFSLFNRSTS
jgi:hypothetical protein